MPCEKKKSLFGAYSKWQYLMKKGDIVFFFSLSLYIMICDVVARGINPIGEKDN